MRPCSTGLKFREKIHQDIQSVETRDDFALTVYLWVGIRDNLTVTAYLLVVALLRMDVMDLVRPKFERLRISVVLVPANRSWMYLVLLARRAKVCVVFMMYF